MKCQTDLAEGDNHACVSTDRSWYCSWVSGVKLWNMKSSILQTLPSFSRHSVAQDFRYYLSSSFPGSIVCTHLWSISSKANHITAQQVDYVVVQLPVPSKVFLFLVNVCALWGFPCNVAAHCVAEVLIRMKACVFSRMLSESLSSARPSTVTISPNTGSKEEPLLTTPLYGELHLHTFPRICWRSSERRKVRSEWSSIGPAFVELRALTRTSTAWKIPTHTSGSRRPSFSVMMLRPQKLWSLKKLPLTIFVVHATTRKWLFLDSRRLCGFQSSCHATCKQRRVWPGASGQQLLGRFRRKFFFFGIFGKSYARGRRETKKIITVA